ncbi:MAG TPA: flagellar protein FlgN [Steroidobacteraceae bacterium]|jgi:flagellar biosynthesis/type III secretory pathway chaperone|nr:flagellar protein FlgN [Steroidobacteraceae bacterium]
MIQDARRRLEDLLDREIELARVLAATLAAEKTALTGDSPRAVEENTAEKIRVLEAIEKLDQERRALCASPTSPGIAASVAERWRSLMDVMAGCRTANEVNGHIIHVRRHQIRQLIDIVRGGPSVTYDPQGKTFARALRELARA